MQFYRKNESGRVWQKNPIIASLHILRDTIIFLLPLKQIPSFAVKFLYGIKPAFIFFIHPRRTEDIYTAFPASVLMRRFLGKNLFLKIISKFPPTVLDVIRAPQNIDGLVVTSPFLAENFIEKREKSVREAVRGLFFGSKLLKKGAVFGLGALWPMVTRRGLALKHYAKSKNINITNGHCGTLISIFLSIKKMSDLSGIRLEELKVAILGVGKMGENLARVLYGKVATLTLVDINEVRLNFVEEKLRKVMSETDIQKYTNRNDFGGIKEILENNHIVVCTTSNIRRILKPEDIPDNCIIIDDSRPEGIPRNLAGNRIVLEGGLMKIKGIVQDYDYGFGIDDNVFGCLAECFLLASDVSRKLTPTLGEVNFENFYKMMSLCQKMNVAVGDFKCRDKIVNEDKIISILRNKKELTATIPFKNICWIFKVEDLLNV
jgi:predicted amino acid dehydrogenase